MAHPCDGHPCDDCPTCRSGRCCASPPAAAVHDLAEERVEQDLADGLRSALERDARLGHRFLHAFAVDRLRSLPHRVHLSMDRVNATNDTPLNLQAGDTTDLSFTTTDQKETHREHR